MCWLSNSHPLEEKGEGFENGNFFWRIGLAFNPNHSLQSLTRHKILKNTNMAYEAKIKSGNIDLAYS